MAKKRGNGEGCISKESTGKYKGRYRIVLTWTAGGKRIRKSKTAWKHADAVATLDKLKAERDSGVVKVKSLTVGRYLDHWAKLQDVADTTREWYRTQIDTHIKPGIGEFAFAEVDSFTIEKWWTEFKAGDRTREAVFTILAAAFDMAVETHKIVRSPFIGVTKPKYEPEEIWPFTIEESKLILTTTKGTREHVIATLALMTGMRIGEILGLEWSRVDLKGCSLKIDQQAAIVDGVVTIKKPKSKASNREIVLTPELVAMIKEHRAILLREGALKSSFVYPDAAGEACNRNAVRTQWWNPLLASLGIEHRGIHHARHTFATHALQSGVDVLVVSKTLGHEKASTTWDTYGHVIKGTENRAVQTVARLFA